MKRVRLFYPSISLSLSPPIHSRPVCIPDLRLRPFPRPCIHPASSPRSHLPHHHPVPSTYVSSPKTPNASLSYTCTTSSSPRCILHRRRLRSISFILHSASSCPHPSQYHCLPSPHILILLIRPSPRLSRLLVSRTSASHTPSHASPILPRSLPPLSDNISLLPLHTTAPRSLSHLASPSSTLSLVFLDAPASS
jgi:hypothetical protein